MVELIFIAIVAGATIVLVCLAAFLGTALTSLFGMLSVFPEWIWTLALLVMTLIAFLGLRDSTNRAAQVTVTERQDRYSRATRPYRSRTRYTL
ncbi:MAG: hypothetical protein HC925_01540 [Coleofasciculaceae cyanobacterium SM2_3_26]|nr:hypothetical protein [Coleofasciculaceae cyanobacterium SM2_3_26]